MIRSLAAMALSLLPIHLLLPLLVVAQSGTADQTESAQRFRAFLAEDWKRWMQDYPEMATAVGFPGQSRRWTDESPAGFDARVKHLRASLATLQQFNRGSLPSSEQLNFDLYHELLETAVQGLPFGDDPMPFRGVTPANRWMPVNQMGGIQQGAAETLATMPYQKPSDYEDIIARLEALPAVVDQTSGNLQEGLKRGYTPPKITMRDVPKQITDLIPADPLKSALLQPLTEFPPNFTAAERNRLTDRAKQIYANSIVPAFQKLNSYLVATYIPACRENITASALPDGAAAYAFHVRWQTTTHLTPEQIHEIGLAVIKRIRGEMDKVIQSTGFQGNFHAFTEFLRTDPQFYYTQPDDLVNAYRIIVKKIDPELAHEFGKLPRLPYGVTPIPAFKAPSQTTAYYQPGAPSAGRPGTYFVNTYNLAARPKWEMEALSLHEAVPGHHLQLALQRESTDLPNFRRFGDFTAFIEGWALYAERLGLEIGLYEDPYSDFGRLSFEMWRACRLVVDTGMHSLGWTRQQAIDYLVEHTAQTLLNITNEVDRYIAWPGQALAYKIGELKFKELRAYATREQGPKFDVRQFHDEVLGNGTLPMDILERRVKEWARQKRAGV
jgi:uncharacterized protein (DUF885 family)